MNENVKPRRHVVRYCEFTVGLEYTEDLFVSASLDFAISLVKVLSGLPEMYFNVSLEVNSVNY